MHTRAAAHLLAAGSRKPTFQLAVGSRTDSGCRCARHRRGPLGAMLIVLTMLVAIGAIEHRTTAVETLPT